MLNSSNQLLISKQSVELHPYIARPAKQYDEMSELEIWNGAGGYLVGDCECHPNFFFIGFKHIPSGKIIKIEAPFNSRKLSWILHNYTVIGFNWRKYDVPLIWYAHSNQNTEAIKEVSNKLVFQNTWPAELQKEYGYTIFKTPYIDLIEVCPLRGSLKLYGGRLHYKRIQELPFDHMKALTREEKDITIDYCINDLDTTHWLADNLSEQLKLRYDLSREYQQDLMSKSDAQIAEAVIGSELKRLTGEWPKKPKLDDTFTHKFQIPHNMQFQTAYMQSILQRIAEMQFTVNENSRLEPPIEIVNLKIQIGEAIYRMGYGGLHSSEENTAIKSNEEYQLYDKDVASYYPAIVLNLGLYPKHIGPVFSEVYKGLVNKRIAAKKAKNIAISECLKITINGTFGKTGSPYSFLYAPEMTIQITVGGQLYLLMLIEALELAGIPVASANTDGILIKCPHSKKAEMDAIVKMWEQQTGFTTEESKYAAVYSRDVNAYLAVKEKNENGEIEVKGKNVYYDPWRAKTARDGYWRFQKNPNAQICVEAAEILITAGIPIQKTIGDCRQIEKFVCVRNVIGGAHKDGHYLGKVVRWYYAKRIVGTINYVISGNKVPDTDGAKPAMDLPDTFPDDIDFIWYERKAKKLLEDMAYLSKPKQLKFF